MRRRAHTIPASSKINVTPLIDVVMVLIIFYLLVGKLASDRLTPVALPASNVGLTDTTSPGLVITITQVPNSPDAAIHFNDTPIALANLPTLLRAGSANSASASISIRADRQLPFAQIRPVLDACREAGLTSVRLATRRSGPNEDPR